MSRSIHSGHTRPSPWRSGLSPLPRTTPGTNRSSRCSSGRCRSTTSAQFRVISDRANGRYRVKHKDAPATVLWPSQSTDVLLGEALGPARFITSVDHPIYRELIEGLDLV